MLCVNDVVKFRGIDRGLAATSQRFGCNKRRDHLFQLIEYSDILANKLITLIVSFWEIKGLCRNSKMSST